MKRMMTGKTAHQCFSNELGQRLLEAWQCGPGTNPDEIQILVGDNVRGIDHCLRSGLEMIAGDLSLPTDDDSRLETQHTGLFGQNEISTQDGRRVWNVRWA